MLSQTASMQFLRFFSTMDSIADGRGLVKVLLCDWSTKARNKSCVFRRGPWSCPGGEGWQRSGGLCGYVRKEHLLRHVTAFYS